MSVLTQNDVRMFLKNYIGERLDGRDLGKFEELPDDLDLLLSGMIDSIGLLELVAAIEEFAGREIDFEMLDPEEMTVVGPLCKFVAQQTGMEN